MSVTKREAAGAAAILAVFAVAGFSSRCATIRRPSTRRHTCRPATRRSTGATSATTPSIRRSRIVAALPLELLGRGAPAFYERLAYDENGQLLNGTSMDYHLPTCVLVPRIETGHGETVSPLNPTGVKSTGEAGAIPVGPLFVQAVEDALHNVDFGILEIPLNSNRL